MATYSFKTSWQFAAPIEQVWDALIDSTAWPRWWRGVKRVERQGDEPDDSVGRVERQLWKSRLPYTLAFTMEITAIEHLRRISGRATGELEGTGTWLLEHRDGVTYVEYDWDVSTTSRWMNLLAPLARPAFAWNHNVVMEWGRVGLERMLAEGRGR